MKTCFIALFLIIGFWHCKLPSKKNETFYFYNAKELFHRNIVQNDSLYYLNNEAGKEILSSDSFSTETGLKVYGLNHYFKFRNYQKDTSFVKHKSYIDSIDYYGTEWFQKEKNLDKFWKSSKGWIDSLRIYTIEPIEGTDSVILRRVHRYFFTIDG